METYQTYLVKFGPRVKKVTVKLEEHVSLKYTLERAIRKLMEADPYMREHSSGGFFMTYFDATTKQDVEVDEETQLWEVDSTMPIQIMLFSSIQLVSMIAVFLRKGERGWSGERVPWSNPV